YKYQAVNPSRAIQILLHPNCHSGNSINMKFQASSLLAVCIAQAIAQEPLAPVNPSWTKQYDLSKVPIVEPKEVGAGLCPNSDCGPNECEKCWESCGNCARPDDIYGCKKGEWALSFDDGPSEHTAELLDILDAAKVKATFLMVGSQVTQFPDVVKRAFDAGHLIAQHTWSHPHLMSLTNEQIIAEVRSTEDAIFNVTGAKTAFIRPPYGEADDRVKGVLTAMGYHNLLWNMDTLDWDIVAKKQDPAKILESFQKAITEGTYLNAHNDPGFISLQHDLYIETVKKVPEIEKLLAEHGFHFVLANSCNNLPMYQNSKDSNITASATTSIMSTTISTTATSTSRSNSIAPTNATSLSSTTAPTTTTSSIDITKSMTSSSTDATIEAGSKSGVSATQVNSILIIVGAMMGLTSGL
ncbi:chitin deacetylase, partial [Basidiobolus ranarum]